jgi:type I restriction enzyme S subunit
VLKAACEGRLVPTESELAKAKVEAASRRLSSKTTKSRDGSSTYEPAKVLLQRILTERREKWNGRGKYKEPAAPDVAKLPELPDGWVWASVEQISSAIVDCLHSTAKFVADGFACVDTTCIKPGKVIRKKLRYVSEATYESRIQRLKPMAKDIIFAREGTVGTAVTIPEDLSPCLGQRVMLLRSDACVLPTYFQHCLNSDIIRAQYLPKIVGSTAPHLNVAEVKLLAIPLPPLTEQERVVAEVERRLSVVDELEITVTANLQRATRLRQSVLQKAFSRKMETIEVSQ